MPISIKIPLKIDAIITGNKDFRILIMGLENHSISLKRVINDYFEYIENDYDLELNSTLVSDPKLNAKQTALSELNLLKQSFNKIIKTIDNEIKKYEAK